MTWMRCSAGENIDGKEKIRGTIPRLNHIELLSQPSTLHYYT